jgi:hypothetical protein
MADERKLKDDTTKLLTSILASEKHGLSVQELSRNFEEFMGYSIPLNKMGYNTCLDYLRDIPHAASLTKGIDGYHVDVVTTEEIARVRKLVERQRDPANKKRSRGGWQGGRGDGGG